MQALETVTVTTTTFCCDGTGHNNITPHLGHPAVYLTFAGDAVDCPYCGRHFVRAAGAAAHGGH
ncbi:MAG: zinc-finger domain-containing protein [Alphaproteobacteria bacterium]|nr:zinc-finger domain-containing protein [Alphaproteobacteria bacterium]NDC56394.1 zinc-finger domain-containing protein [Alphaproteobacteria bacterium]NDG04587.1 zinc-finger domain-containing protein [Alphaproteobacteria bacterium]